MIGIYPILSTILVMLLGATLQAETGWHYQASGTNKDLSDLQFIDHNRGWAVGDTGTLLTTVDGGMSWVNRSLSTDKGLRAIHFKNVDTGWTVGDSGSIFGTSDGGVSWTAVASNTHHHLRRIQFLSPDTGWILGDSGVVLRTVDGGNTWGRQAQVHLDSLHPYSMRKYVLICGDFADHALGLACYDNGDASGNNPYIYRTQDGGGSWQRWRSGRFQGGWGFTGFSFVSDSVGFFFHSKEIPCAFPQRCNPTYRPALFKTWGPADSIRTVNIPELPELSRLNRAAFGNSRTGWIVGNEFRGGGYILKTVDGGENWTKEDGVTTHPLTGLHALDSKRVWVFGANGTILATTQGGGSVSTLPPSFSEASNFLGCLADICSYEVFRTQRIRISLFDGRGVLLRTLVNETMGRGRYTLSLSATGLTSGMYFFAYSRGNGTQQVRKVFIP
jgi:photosystem II stability/assembly factor-like uncharacterized protein